MVYFDNAASTYPKPPCVIKAVSEWLRKNGANPGRSGHRMSMDAAEMIYNTRVAVADLFGVKKPENVVLVPGATYALNTVLFGCFKPGDHIITTDLEHNSVLRPLWHLKKQGVEVSFAQVDFSDDTKTVFNIMSQIKENTKGIVCTQCSNVCGFRLSIHKIAAAKPQGICMVVDGSQGAGIIPTDISSLEIDYYCAPSHKGLLGPQGGGILLVNNKPPYPLVFGGTGNETLNPEQPAELPERLESGTLPSPICAGMLAAVKYIKSKGTENIFDQKRKLTDYAYERLNGVKDICLYMRNCAGKCLGVVPINLNGKTSAELSEYLDSKGICVRGGLHCAPLFHQRMKTVQIGMVRLSFGIYNNENEIDYLVNMLKKII